MKMVSIVRSMVICGMTLLCLLLTAKGNDEYWCVADTQQSDYVIQKGLDWACGPGNADCSAIQPNRECYLPNTLNHHASFAFNSYWQKYKCQGATCSFDGAARLTTLDPRDWNGGKEVGDGASVAVAIAQSVRGFVRSLVEDLSNGRSPSIVLDRYRTYCSDPSGSCACSSATPFAKEIISINKQPHAAHRLAVLLRLLSIIQQLLQQNKHASKRDVFYMDPALFVDQAFVDHVINDICSLFICSRHYLNVVPVGKGLLMGWLRFKESDRTISCIKNPNTEYQIPACLEEVEDIVSVAQYILVVEKETVFQRLANDKFCDKNRCIVITGRGYPDVPTRRFVRHLIEELRLPVYCLVDSDPYGFDILTTYRFGSTQMAYDAKLMRVPDMQWLGVLPSDFEEFNLPVRCLLNLTLEDKMKVEAMLSRCYLFKEAPQWRKQLEMMLHKGVKFEIEALSAISFTFLSEVYIPTKIHGRHI